MYNVLLLVFKILQPFHWICAESFSRRQAKEASRREQARARRVGGGERRTSVCSAPESENSDQSDDDSVRSLPAGECTPREHIPKQCASSGGTPQTSYADIAKAPEPANSNQFSPSPTTGASDHPINFPSRKTVPFSPPSNKGGGEGRFIQSYYRFAITVVSISVWNTSSSLKHERCTNS